MKKSIAILLVCVLAASLLFATGCGKLISGLDGCVSGSGNDGGDKTDGNGDGNTGDNGGGDAGDAGAEGDTGDGGSSSESDGGTSSGGSSGSEGGASGGGNTSGGEVVPQTYTVTFVAEGETVGKLSFTEGDTSVSEPEVLHKDCCVGAWDSYTLGNKNITVNAVYSEPHAFLNKVEANDATCPKEGNIEYYTCNDCGKYFSDDKGKNEISDVRSEVVDCSYVDGCCKWCGAKKPSEGLAYQLSDDGSYYTVTGIGSCTDTELVIPKQHDGKPIKAIGDRAFYGRNLKSVTIPDRAILPSLHPKNNYCTL